MPDYTNYTSEQLIEAQNQLTIETGEEIRGILGGLPVATQTQEYFVVFDEAGSTGPEIIDKTQFRITYLVDSKLNTSKPTDEGDAALNATQNFEKGAYCNVRADNATVLNQNLTGKQGIYDIGSLQLLSTTEYGKGNDEYITTMSFNSVGGQLVGTAQNISSAHRQVAPTSIYNDVTQKVEMSTVITAVSGTDWVEWDGDELEFLQSTLDAGTRLRTNLGGQIFIVDVYAGNTVEGTIKIYNDPVGATPAQELASFPFSFSVPNVPTAPQGTNFSFNLLTSYQDFSALDKVYAELSITGLSSNANTYAYFKNISISFQQETPAGDILVMGVNATTASYWDGVQTISGSGVNPNDLNKAYSILTGSDDITLFSNGEYLQRINTASEAFDPENDGNTFNPIQLPFQFLTGDEIRFEYNQNKVHKVIRTELTDDNKLALFITPGVNTQAIAVEGSTGTQLNHFTHYRIVQNGGYLFINTKKDNVAGVEQDFKGIITPQQPSENLGLRGDELIFALKEAGIIET
jgi:hypothetical protein